MHIAADKVAEIIILAREEGRGEREFDAFIDALNDEERAALVAVFWIGRGSFEAEDYQEAFATAQQEATTPTQDYLAGSPHLADHLEAGLVALGIDPAEAEDDLYRP